MIRVVIDHEQQRSNVCLLLLTRRDRGEEVDGDVLGEALQRLAVGLELLHARVPRRRVWWRRISWPVIVRPIQRMHVLRIDTEVEEIFLCETHVLQQLPDRVLKARWY